MVITLGYRVLGSGLSACVVQRLTVGTGSCRGEALRSNHVRVHESVQYCLVLAPDAMRAALVEAPNPRNLEV